MENTFSNSYSQLTQIQQINVTEISRSCLVRGNAGTEGI